MKRAKIPPVQMPAFAPAVLLRFTETDRAALDELRRVGSFLTDEAAIRAALDHYATRHFDLRLPPDAFLARGLR